MSAFWVRFTNGRKSLCAEGETEAKARERAVAVVGDESAIRDVRVLPYPAEPRLEPYETHHPVMRNPESGKYEPDTTREIACPSFCYRPDQCAGRTCCPQDYACSE